MSNWKEYRLGDCIEFIIDNRGKNPPLSNNGYELIETISINSENKYPDYSKISKFVSKDTYNNWFRKGHPKKGDILISTVGANIGRVSIMNENRGCIAQNLIGLRTDKEKLVPDYLYYFLIKKSTQHTLSSLNIGSAQPSIKVPHLLNILINVPNIQRQEEIANILSSLDEKIELNTQINQTLEQIAQALFKSWFVDFDPVRAKIQALSDGLSLEQAELAAMQTISGKTPEELTALSQTQPDRYAELAETAKAFPCEMVEVDGVEVPKGWTFQYLKDACNIVYGKGLPKTKLTNTGYRVFGANGVIGYYSEFMYKNPQILIGCRGTVGQVTVSTPFSFITNNSLIIEYENSLINRYYLEHYLRTLNLKEISSGSVQPQITIQNMSGVKLLTPNRETLLLYEINVKDIYETMYQNQIENEKLTKVRDLLLPKLLNGEIE